MANDLATLLTSDKMQKQVALCLPKHLSSERFLRVMLTQVRKVPKLAHCTQDSVLACMMDLAAKGLEPDGRNAHLIPFENRRERRTECQLIIDYKGLVELAMRSGKISRIHADVVCENDEFEYDRGEIVRHKVDFRRDRGAPYAAYSIAKMKDGSEACCVMGFHEIEAVRKRSRAATAGPWVTDWNEMAKKTTFRRLSKWLPLSPEYRDTDDFDTPDIVISDAKTTKTNGKSLQQLVEDSSVPSNGNGHAPDPEAVHIEPDAGEPTEDFPPPDDEPATASLDEGLRKGNALADIKSMLHEAWPDSPKSVSDCIGKVFKVKSIAALERWTADQIEKGLADLKAHLATVADA